MQFLTTPKMKTIYLLFIAIFCYSNLLLAQSSKTCTKNEDVLVDLSSITKCSVEKVKDKSNNIKSELKISYRRVRRRAIKKETIKNKELATGINTASKGISTTLTINNSPELNLKKVVAAREVLFSVADQIPLFPKCSSVKKEEAKKCFNQQISNHFAKNFRPQEITDEAIKGRIFIQFTVDYKGNATNIEIKSQKKSTLLESEVKKIIQKLPKLSPGVHKGLPVNIKYSIPINIDVE